MQTSCFQALLQFNPQIHYLSVDPYRDNLRPVNKSDLSLTQRVIHFFWKPSNERIQYVMESIFRKLKNEEFDTHSPQELLLVVHNLENLNVKVAAKGLTKYCIDLSKIRDTIYFIVNKARLEKAFHIQIIENEQKLSDLVNSIQSAEAKLETAKALNTSIEQETRALGEAKREVENKHQRFVDEAENEARRMADAANLLKAEIEKLSNKKKVLESDTVFWTEEGYVLANSACFDPTSFINAGNLSAMPQPSEKVTSKLLEIQKEKPELAASLQSMKKQVYLENITLRQMKMALSIIEKGSKKRNILSDNDLEALNSLADYLLDLRFKEQINGMRRARRNPKINARIETPTRQSPSQPAPTLANFVITELKQLKKIAKGLVDNKQGWSKEMDGFFTRFIRLKF